MAKHKIGMANLLVVEDDENLRETMQDWLVFEKHIVSTAVTGPEAIEQLSMNDFDLIILDWYLPDMNGIDVLKKYRAGGGTTPVLLLTGHDSLQAREAAMAAGANSFLSKPFKLQQLSEEMESTLKIRKEWK